MELGAEGGTVDDRHPVFSLVSAAFWVILWFVKLTTITIPATIFRIVSWSWSFTLNFYTILGLLLASAVALNYYIRFSYLNSYAELKEPALPKPDANELHPDVNVADSETPTSYHNYLDEFLQAVRVFGFLEKPVFHELARHLQTRRLVAGDSMSLDDDKSFYAVIDGMVQVYAKDDGVKSAPHGGTWDHEDMNGYQLLNEVGSGGTLSSLFTILSLFTEDVKMSWKDGEEDMFEEDRPEPPRRTRPSRANSDVSMLNINNRPRRLSGSSSASTVQADSLNLNSPPLRETPRSPSVYEEDVSSPHTPKPNLRSQSARVRHGVIARATEDSTLAVIPAEAFKRLTKKFPKSAGHIVQVILTRFSRVTFAAAHKYLGLTSEVLRTEKAINEIACHPLPASFYEGGGLQYLRQKFDVNPKEGTPPVEEDEDYFGLGNRQSLKPTPASSASSNKTGSSRASTLTGKTLAESPLPAPPARKPLHRMPTSRHFVAAGDLHTNSNDIFRPMKRTFSVLSVTTPRVRSMGLSPDSSSSNVAPPIEDFDLREEVMSCIAKSIGLLQPPLSGTGTESVEASPSLGPSGGSFNTSSFSSLSMLDMADDTSSIGGNSINAGGYMSGLDNEVEILSFPAGATLAKAGERNTGLFFVIEGFLDILLPIEETQTPESKSKKPKTSGSSAPPPKPKRPQQQKLLFTVKPGGIAGYLASLCSIASYVDIKAKTDVYVGFLPSHALERIIEKRPIVLLTLSKRLISMLSPLILQIDSSLDWMQVDAGQVLWRPEDASDSFYIVINGRLRAIEEEEVAGAASVKIVGEYGQGDTVGELDVITSSPRRSTVHAIRDTELIRMPKTLFQAISARNPQTTAQLLRMIASRVRDEVDSSSAQSHTSELRNNTNLKTVAILPVSRNVPVDIFARKLQQALEGIGASTSYLNQASISSHLGRHAFTRMGKLKSAGWLADQEQRYRTVLYVADSPVGSAWTQTCIRQADCVMIVGMGDDPSIGEYERLLTSMKTTARKELILLHSDRYIIPGSTRLWLKNRPWVHQHIHVELPGLHVPIVKMVQPSQEDPGAVGALKNLKEKVQTGIKRYRGVHPDARPQRPPHTNDFARLARRICGKSIGVVLGGGGARGIAHLGVLRALEEWAIPIDHIGGTSIGALVGGLYAREGDIISSSGRAKHFSGRMANIWRMLGDVTYPIVAYTTGHEFNRGIYKAFYELHIEDMWLPFFCNTMNITTSKQEVHETGYAWRYIRASMTLVGLLPPLCDNGNMLVDGGYVDNLPVVTMLSMGTSAVFACDIDDNSPRHYGDSVSGFWLLLGRWNPFAAPTNIPAITEIQARLAYSSSVKMLEDAKVARGCFYMQMPVQDYGTMQFGKFEEIQRVGYQATLEFLEKWEEEGKLPAAYIDGQGEKTGGRRLGKSARRNSI